MDAVPPLPAVTAIGPDPPGNVPRAGAYVLRMALGADLALAFGRFRHGRAVALPAGQYVYVGSAMGRGGGRLEARLLRHATRSGTRPPHQIRADLIEYFAGAAPERREVVLPASKRLHWHVDYLLDRLEVELTQVVLVNSSVRQEPEIARILLDDPHTVVIEQGLGAADVPGGTHILRVQADEAWWRRLPDRIRAWLL